MFFILITQLLLKFDNSWSVRRRGIGGWLGRHYLVLHAMASITFPLVFLFSCFVTLSPQRMGVEKLMETLFQYCLNRWKCLLLILSITFIHVSTFFSWQPALCNTRMNQSRAWLHLTQEDDDSASCNVILSNGSTMLKLIAMLPGLKFPEYHGFYAVYDNISVISRIDNDVGFNNILSIPIPTSQLTAAWLGSILSLYIYASEISLWIIFCKVILVAIYWYPWWLCGLGDNVYFQMFIGSLMMMGSFFFCNKNTAYVDVLDH